MLRFYNKYILPKRLNKEMGQEDFNENRSTTVEPAQGVVLEIGFGSGYNLPFYKNIKKLYALDPSHELYSYAKDRIDTCSFPVEYLSFSAENIPLEDNTVDTVVSTWSLCSIPDLTKALSEIKRVLKPEGRFLFIEHGLHTNKINSLGQKMASPVSKFFCGNCHLDRPIDKFIENSGLKIEKIEMSPEEGRPLMFSYQGIAIKV